MGKKQASHRLKRMFVIGAYGCGNLGDDAILQSICHQFHDWDICATQGTSEDVGAFYGIRTVPCRLNEGFSASVAASMLVDSFKMAREIMRCDALMFGGGSLIHDVRPYNLPFMFVWHALAKLLRKRVYYFSMGVGPIDTRVGKWLCKTVLQSADGLFVRDDRGRIICESLGLSKVVQTADAALAYKVDEELPSEVRKGLPERYIAVTGSEWFTSSNFWKRAELDFSAETRAFAAWITVASRIWNLPVVFVPTVAHDRKLAARLKEHLTDIDFRMAGEEGDWTPSIAALVIEGASFLLGVRMHSLIFAARHGVPFVALIYDGKVDELVKLFGMESYALPLQGATESAVSDCVLRARKNAPEISARLNEQTRTLQAKVLDSVAAVEADVIEKITRGGVFEQQALIQSARWLIPLNDVPTAAIACEEAMVA